ncbi:MAG: acyltransferase family protein [Candidatus Lokiarchaeota archaeon]|nr:acyltransferase family protein [Candidatus Lokiarchaeota archaeon]
MKNHKHEKRNNKHEVERNGRRILLLDRDWRIELTRILSIFAIIIIHMLIYSGWIPIGSLLAWPIVVAVGGFMYSAGFVSGLKNDFNKPDSLTFSSYFTYIKKRFLRLYIGYYIMLIFVFIARVLSNTLPPIRPFNLFLDLTSLWCLFGPSYNGSIFAEGWFLGCIFIISAFYPFLRRIKSKNLKYMYIIIIFAAILRIGLLFINPLLAYFPPYAWITEYSIGMLFGSRSARNQSVPEIPKNFKLFFAKLGKRTWALYLVHVIPILFISTLAPWWEFFLIFAVIFILLEIFYPFLNTITGFLVKNPKKIVK